MNDNKLIISQRAVATKLPSPTTTAARTASRQLNSLRPLPKKIASKINNLPGADFIVTSEILRTNVCRICATYYESGPKLVPLYISISGSKLSKMVNAFLPIKVREQDGLPEYVCRTCTNTLLAWRDMRDSVAESNKILVAQAEILAGIPRVTRSERSAEPLAFKEEDLPDNDSDDDSDSAPLAKLVSADPLAALRRALRDLRDHYNERHLRSHPETSSEESGPDEGDLNPDRFDDLTRRNMRRDRFDDATRQALDAARVRADGRTYYVCIICGRRLASPHAFVHHTRIHTGERPQVCHVCGKRFRAPQGLARHIAETHERRRRRACRLCQRTFANEQNLRQHLRTHTGERPYQCNECGKRFAQSGSLHAHRRTHTLRRAFTCADCGAAFRLRAGLTRHALRHSGERPHRCACGRAFAAKHELMAHLPLHGDQTPHVCGICGAAYKLRRALRDHTRRVHPPPASSVLHTADLTRASAFPGTMPM